MPDQIDANKAYEKRIAPYQRGGGKIPLTIQKYKDFFSTHRNPADEQLEFDVALWYAFLASPLTDTQWKQVMVKRIFTLLAFGGLLGQRHDANAKLAHGVGLCFVERAAA